MFPEPNSTTRYKVIAPGKLDEIFNDFEARNNLVSLYGLLLKIDRRNNPHLYQQPEPPQSTSPNTND